MTDIDKNKSKLDEAISKLTELQRYIYDYSLKYAVNGFAHAVIARDLNLSEDTVYEAVKSPQLRAAWNAKKDLRRSIEEAFCRDLAKLCNRHNFHISQAIITKLKPNEKVVYSTFEDHELYLAESIKTSIFRHSINT